LKRESQTLGPMAVAAGVGWEHPGHVWSPASVWLQPNWRPDLTMHWPRWAVSRPQSGHPDGSTRLCRVRVGAGLSWSRRPSPQVSSSIFVADFYWIFMNEDPVVSEISWSSATGSLKPQKKINTWASKPRSNYWDTLNYFCFLCLCFDFGGQGFPV
jgi:hypothetical protein